MNHPDRLDHYRSPAPNDTVVFGCIFLIILASSLVALALFVLFLIMLIGFQAG